MNTAVAVAYRRVSGLGEALLGQPVSGPDFQIEPAADASAWAAYHALRTQVFVHQQGLFRGHDRDEREDDPRTLALIGMLAEASGCRAVLDVAAVPRPAAATVGDWLTCFPGFGMLTADEPGRRPPSATPAVSADCGELQPGCGVALRWPDGELTEVLDGAPTGLGPAGLAPGRRAPA